MKRRLLIVGAILAVMIFCAVGTAYSIKYQLNPVETTAVKNFVRVEIEPGATAGLISTLLSEKGLIRNALIFRIYVRYHQLEQKFIAGPYKLSPAMSLPEIAVKITSGDVDPETFWFTIPEGYTIEQIADHLAETSLIDRQAFLKQAAQPSAKTIEQFPFLQEAEANSQVKYTLEGYLFPDTYELAVGSSGEALICLMLHRFETVFNRSLQRRCEELELTLHQALTLASIIEGETRAGHERKRIAGVFHNRLKNNWFLGSCATVQYILPGRKENLSVADTQTTSPYNTYLNLGLPPGPIGAPGKASIEAALYPENTDSFYFVSKRDGTGEHYFSRTLSEHQRYKNKAEKK